MIKYTATRIVASVFLLSVASLIIAFVAVKISGGELLSVQSGSMVPNIKKGDVVVATRVPESQLAVGDVVTFINPSNSKQTITHRLVELPSISNQQKYITKGDANPSADQPIAASSIIGKSSFSLPYAGFGLDFVKKPIGLILLIYVPALMVVASEIRRLSQYYKTREPYYANESIRRRLLSRTSKNKGALAAKSIAVGIVATVFVYVPTQAALSNTATLTGTTISTVNSGTPSTNIVFRALDLQCSTNNTALANRRPKITMYNSGNQNIDISGWKISDNNGVIITFPTGKILKKKHNLYIEPFLNNGLQYGGDNLKLVNSSGQNIDGLSWGSDVSELNPSISKPSAGTKLKRKKPKIDTNAATDWKSNDHRCSGYDDDDDNHCNSVNENITQGTYNTWDSESSDETSTENNTDIDVDINQCSSTGDVTNSDNTNGGSATSGNASNSSSVNISVQNSN